MNLMGMETYSHLVKLIMTNEKLNFGISLMNTYMIEG